MRYTWIHAINEPRNFSNKKDSTVLAKNLQTSPWNIAVEGEAEKTGVFNLEDILKNNPLEERIYRFRCVEAWAMVVPWIGFSLATMLKQFKPTSKAKFVEFTTLYDPKVMIGQKTKVLSWPYVEGLRIDEAMNPLAFMATGMYDETPPNQNGAPLRLVVPWKYGFKSIKAIVKM
jgi:sulfoxide reductase catalytic subunit YedY